MKKAFFTVVLLAMAMLVFAQPAPRQTYPAEVQVTHPQTYTPNGLPLGMPQTTKEIVMAYDEENAERQVSRMYPDNVRIRFLRWVPQAEYGQVAQSYRRRGNTYYERGDYDRAIDDYTQAIRLEPNNGQHYGNRGVAYRDKGDYDRAIADFTQWIRLDPNNANAYRWRGRAYFQKGNFTHARTDVNRALQINPNHEQAQTLSEELRRRGY
jgi:tetratricopeptide (TPR) repeat protein